MKIFSNGGEVQDYNYRIKESYCIEEAGKEFPCASRIWGNARAEETKEDT